MSNTKKKPKPKPKLKLKIAWTADDGPTSQTPAMLKVFKTALKKPIPVTWYIQYDYLANQGKEGFYKNLQDKHGHEIAIHGVSAISNHVHWFPTDNSKHTFISTQKAVDAIKIFKAHLTKHGISAKFVRVPTGLHSELMAYLKKLKMLNKALRNKTARDIIKGQLTAKSKNKTISKVAADLQTLKAGLKGLDLHLWGGNSKGKITAQSWEVETAGNRTGRVDSLNKTYMKDLYKNTKKDRSLVILCHDTKAADVTAVAEDIKMMEDFAKKNNIEISYYTMSNLYKEVVGNTL